MTDHVLRELWSIKDGLANECEHDLRRLFDKLKAIQKSSRRPVVDRTRQRPKVGASD